MLAPNVTLSRFTAAALAELIPQMSPGQSVVYHTGSLMFDKLRGAHFQTVFGVAKIAWDAYEKGEVTLVQHKLAPLVYEYIAIKRKALPAR